MYAVVKSGGKQYRVRTGDRIKLEKLALEVGADFAFDYVLACGDSGSVTVGAPFLNTVKVKATVLAHGQHDKVKIFKMRRRKHYQKHQGHRQQFTEVRIGEIQS